MLDERLLASFCAFHALLRRGEVRTHSDVGPAAGIRPFAGPIYNQQSQFLGKGEGRNIDPQYSAPGT